MTAVPANTVFHVKRRPLRQLVAMILRGVVAATRRTRLNLKVTLSHLRPYALTVGGLACFVVGAFTLSRALGWFVAGAAALLFEWHREGGGG